MLTKKKKIFIVTAFCLLLAVTGALNIILNSNIIGDGNAAVTTANFFSTYRTDRQLTRDQQVLYLDAIISSESSSKEAKDAAELKKQEIISLLNQELVLEGIMKSKGFAEVVVSTTTSSLNVIVKGAQLTDMEVAQIVDIVSQQTNYTVDNIKIIPVE